MIEDDHIGAGGAGGLDRRQTVGAAVHRDDQARAARGEFAHRLRIWSITLEYAVWNVDFRPHAEMCEKPLQERRRRRAVNIVVAEDRTFSRRTIASASRSAAASMPVSVAGLGNSSRIVGSRKRGVSSEAMPRPASTRATRSETPCPCAMARAAISWPLVQPMLPRQSRRRARHTEKIALVRAISLSAYPNLPLDLGPYPRGAK